MPIYVHINMNFQIQECCHIHFSPPIWQLHQMLFLNSATSKWSTYSYRYTCTYIRTYVHVSSLERCPFFRGKNVCAFFLLALPTWIFMLLRWLMVSFPLIMLLGVLSFLPFYFILCLFWECHCLHLSSWGYESHLFRNHNWPVLQLTT